MQFVVSQSAVPLVGIGELVQLSVFLGFFAFAAVVLYVVARGEETARRRARQAFIVALIVGLAVPTATGLPFPPFASYGYFSPPAEQSETQYHVTVVDADGNELRYSAQATPPGRVGTQAGRMLTRYSERERTETAAFLLRSAREHRRDVADGLSPIEWIRYRSNAFLPSRSYHAWSPEELDEYGRFVGVRVYRVEVHTADDGLSITRVNRTLAYEYPE